MKSLPWGNMGNVNMRGRKSLDVADDTARNFTERERIRWEERLAAEEVAQADRSP